MVLPADIGPPASYRDAVERALRYRLAIIVSNLPIFLSQELTFDVHGVDLFTLEESVTG
jgi:hypothetical protein